MKILSSVSRTKPVQSGLHSQNWSDLTIKWARRMNTPRPHRPRLDPDSKISHDSNCRLCRKPAAVFSQ